MKKLLFCAVLMLCAGMATAENMKFVTLLSQPVGSFASVEMLDQENPTEIFHLNFCNAAADSGKIIVSAENNGTPVVMNNLVVNSAAVLGGNLDTVSSRRLIIALNSDFTGGNLVASRAAPSRVLVDDGAGASGEAAFEYVKTLKTRTANFNKMYIPETANLKHTATETGAKVLPGQLSWKTITCAVDDDEVCLPTAYFLTSLGSSAARKELQHLAVYDGIYIDSALLQQNIDKVANKFDNNLFDEHFSGSATLKKK